LGIPPRDRSFGTGAPSYEELVAETAQQASRITELEASIGALELEIERLRRELGRHSGNSGKPPSSDTLTQRAEQKEERLSRQERRQLARQKAKELEERKLKRRPGKQPGAPGTSLAKVTDPDLVEDHAPECCAVCGESLAGAPVEGTEVRQVFDLPTKHLEVTEHRAETRRCGCGALTKAQFPPEAKAATCYGPVIRAVAVYLMIAQHLPVARTAALLSEVCMAPVSVGWLASLAQEAAGNLEGFIETLRAQLIAEDVLHADETGARICGSRYWFHVACSDLLTLLDCHPKRGAEALDDMAVLPFFSGTLVTDGWKPYWSLDGFDHALCLAHLLRDLAALSQCPGHREWADQMADLLVEAKCAVEEAVSKGESGLIRGELKALRSRYTKILNRGFAEVPAYHSAGSYNRDAFNLLNRLSSQREEVTRYWSNPAVDPTNNQAERDLRMVKLQQKISGCFRTVEGAKAFCAVRSYIHTAQKQGLGHLDVLLRLFKGDPWIPAPAASSP